MSKNRQIVLENPFHPLDLSPHDLLAIYKRFEESRVINRNPKQELPIETITQLISALKGCPPSYIQKCISQALIKPTISWNEFLTFLDQQSQVRERILDWLMFERTAVKYKLEKEWSVRSKISRFYDEVTFLQFIENGAEGKLAVCCVDQMEFHLLEETSRISIIDSYVNKSDRNATSRVSKEEEDKPSNLVASKFYPRNESKMKRGLYANRSVTRSKNEKSERAGLLSTKVAYATTSKMPTATLEQDDDQFYIGERANINSMFNVFKGLNLENSLTYARLASQKIREKKVTGPEVAQLKETYSALQEEDKDRSKRIIVGKVSNVRPLEQARNILGDLKKQKRVLSYNPYKKPRMQEGGDVVMSKGATTRERKQACYTHRANQVGYSARLRCLAIMHFNMELSLVKVVHEYNKLTLEEQAKIRVIMEKDHKKNEVIEGVDFYYHSIVNKWFLIVLIRVEFKNDFRNENQSYIRGYELKVTHNKRRNADDYSFRSRKEAFTLQIGERRGREGQDLSTMHEIFGMEMQMEYGMHFISVSGKYLCYRENFIEGDGQDNSYFSFHHEEKFKNTGLHLSCLSVGTELNKIVFGTIRGLIIIYDVFSHQFRSRKVSNSAVVQVRVEGNLVYLLTADEKFIVYDLVKVEEVQALSVRNENKLHQKTRRFDINGGKVYLYGTEIRCYAPYNDEKIVHEQRKMQTIYRWRLDKLFQEQASYKKKPQIKTDKQPVKPIAQMMPRNAVKGRSVSSVQMVLSSESFFLVLTDILELIVVEKRTLKIKFTMILSVPHDSKVMRMALSPNQKLLAVLRLNQNIHIFNIHTQEQYQHMQPAPFLKYTAITFLDAKNEYLLANGTEHGKIVLSPYNAIPEKNPKILSHHGKAVTALTVVRKEYLVSCGEDMVVAIWLLPFNILKHEIKLQASLGCVIESVGSWKEYAFMRTIEGVIIEISTHEGKMSRTIKDRTSWQSCVIDGVNGTMMGVEGGSQLQVLNRKKEEWALSSKVKLEGLRGQIRALGVVQSEKAVVFLESGVVLPWSYDNQKLGKSVNLCQE